MTGPAGFDGDDIVEAAGIFKIMFSYEFVFILRFIKDILESIEPINASLQSKTIGYVNAMRLIKAVAKTIKDMRSDVCFKIFYTEAEQLLKSAGLINTLHGQARPIRNRRRNIG